MARARTFLGRHWRGQLPLPLAVFAVLLALHGLAVWLVSLWNPHLVGSIAATIMALLGLGLWQVVGTFRTLDRSIAARRNMAMITAGYGAIGLVMVSTVVQGVDLVLANGPPPLVSAAAANGVALSEDGRVLVVEGDITLRGFTALEKALADHPGIQTVRLRSDGGNISAARGMVRLIEATGLETQVSGRCFSACTLVFMAGEPRVLLPGGALGFHRYWMSPYDRSGAGVFINLAEEQDKDRAFFRRRGVSGAFLSRIFQADADAIWQPGREELLRAGVLTSASSR